MSVEAPGRGGEAPEIEAGEAGRPLAGSFAATAAIQLAQLGVALMLARALGPSGRGELAAVILWPTLIMTLGNLGLGQATTYHAARAQRLGTLVGSVLAVVAAISIVLVAVGLVAVPLALANHESGVIGTSQLYLLAFVPLSLVALGMMSVLNGLHRFRWFHGLRLLLAGGTLVGIAALAAVGEMTIESAAAVYAAAYLLTALAALVAVLREMRVRPAPAPGGTESEPASAAPSGMERAAPSRERLAASRQTMRSLLSFGWKSQLSTTMWALNERLDQLVISIFLSSTSLGLYVVAVNLTSLTTLVGFSFALVALPMLARAARGEERRRAARAIVGATIVLAVAVSVPILVLEPVLVELLFGSEFGGAVDVGRVLLVAATVFALNRVLEALLQAEGRPLESSIGEGIALAVTAAGLAALLPLMGIMGAGVTSLLAYATSAVFLVVRVTRAMETSAAELLVPDLGLLRRLAAEAAGRRR